VAEYEYRCARCGSYTVQRPMGSAAPSAPCPSCGGDGRRSFSALPLRRTPGAFARALERQEAGTDRPEVVTSLPPRRTRRRAPADPRHATLPRR
jgi:putative FmdB family regulatory protein